MVALQSLSELGWPGVRFSTRSVSRQVAVTTTIKASADKPYCQTEKAQTGNRASTTCSMMRFTLRSLTI